MKYRCAGPCGQDLEEAAFHRYRGAGRTRPVTARCKACRREDYYAARYATTCACCLKHRPLQGNAACRLCNEESGLRECRACRRVLPLFLSFYGRSRTCKDCRGRG